LAQTPAVPRNCDMQTEIALAFRPVAGGSLGLDNPTPRPKMISIVKRNNCGKRWTSPACRATVERWQRKSSGEFPGSPPHENSKTVNHHRRHARRARAILPRPDRPLEAPVFFFFFFFLLKRRQRGAFGPSITAIAARWLESSCRRICPTPHNFQMVFKSRPGLAPWPLVRQSLLARVRAPGDESRRRSAGPLSIWVARSKVHRHVGIIARTRSAAHCLGQVASTSVVIL